MGFEPTTASLEGWNSTTELRPPVSKPKYRVLSPEEQFLILLNLSTSHSRLTTGNLLWCLFGRQESLRGLPVEQALLGGQARIRTLEADGNRFTVCPLWPLGYLPETPCTGHKNLSAQL